MSLSFEIDHPVECLSMYEIHLKLLKGEMKRTQCQQLSIPFLIMCTYSEYVHNNLANFKFPIDCHYIHFSSKPNLQVSSDLIN